MLDLQALGLTSVDEYIFYLKKDKEQSLDKKDLQYNNLKKEYDNLVDKEKKDGEKEKNLCSICNEADGKHLNNCTLSYNAQG